MKTERLKYLLDRIQGKNATKLEKDEYMKYIYEEGRLREKDYIDYKNGIDVDSIIKYAIISGLGMLAVRLINARLSNKKVLN